jgi:hypothetical protein
MGLIHVYIDPVDDVSEIKFKTAVKGKVYKLVLERDEVTGTNQLRAAEWLGQKLFLKLKRLGAKMAILFRNRRIAKVKKSVKVPGAHKLIVETPVEKYVAKLALQVRPKGKTDTNLLDGVSPSRVVLSGVSRCPVGCDKKYFEQALSGLRKTGTYTYSNSMSSWKVNLGKQTGEPVAGGWEVLVDGADGADATWVMALTWLYDDSNNELSVKVLWCEAD